MKRGRPKGYTPYINIKYEDLADWVGRKTKIPVSRKWLEVIMGEELQEEYDLDSTDEPCHHNTIEEKIEYTLTKFEDE